MPLQPIQHTNQNRAPSVRTLLLWPTLLLTTVGLLIIIVWAGWWIQRLFISQAEQELEIEAFLIANALRDPLSNFLEGEGPSGRPLGNLVLSYAADTGARVVVNNMTFAPMNLVQENDGSTPLRQSWEKMTSLAWYNFPSPTPPFSAKSGRSGCAPA